MGGAPAFINEINRLVPEARVTSAVFEEPWLDIGVFPGAHDDNTENPWGLPWWPKSRVEMYLSGFVSTSLVLVLFACGWCGVVQRIEKRRRATGHVPVSPRSIAPASDP